MGNWEAIWQGDGARRLWSVPDQHVLRLAASWKRSGTVRRILDLGCGVGRHVHLFAAEGFEVCGLDHSETALTTCRNRLRSEGLAADLRLGDMRAIPFPDGHFDAVVAFNSIYHGLAAEVDAGVELVRQKLRAGGVCFATFLSRGSRLYGKGVPIEPHTYSDPRMYKELLGGDGESGVTHHFSSEDEVRHFFRAYEIESGRARRWRCCCRTAQSLLPQCSPCRESGRRCCRCILT